MGSIESMMILLCLFDNFQTFNSANFFWTDVNSKNKWCWVIDSTLQMTLNPLHNMYTLYRVMLLNFLFYLPSYKRIWFYQHQRLTSNEDFQKWIELKRIIAIVLVKFSFIACSFPCTVNILNGIGKLWQTTLWWKCRARRKLEFIFW